MEVRIRNIDEHIAKSAGEMTPSEKDKLVRDIKEFGGYDGEENVQYFSQSARMDLDTDDFYWEITVEPADDR